MSAIPLGCLFPDSHFFTVDSLVLRYRAKAGWLFSGSLAAGERAAEIMSLIQTAKMNHIELLAYLTDVLSRLPTHPNSRIEELLPTR